MKSKNIKVAHVLEGGIIIINYGFRENVSTDNSKIRLGDILEIYEGGFEVIDPDTKESLGVYENIKSTIEVIDMKDRFSICKIVDLESSIQKMYLSPMHKKLHSNDVSDIHVGDKVRRKF